MRTKALVLTAALAAAGVATSMAQVYSVNAVGYVNKTLSPGFNLVANPLNAANNTVGALFTNFQGGVPAGTRVYIFKNGVYVTAQWEALDEAFIPAEAAAEVIPPGTGVFIFVGGSTDRVLTFVGEVMQGSLSNPIPQGFSIKANQVPQSARPDTIPDGSIPGGPGDRFFRYNTTSGVYNSWQYEPLDEAWIGGGDTGLPTIDVGEAFFFFRSGASTSWTRSFSVNTN